MQISIIIPMYNAEGTIIQTLKSLENQTIRDFDIVIVDDGSQDTSPELVKQFSNQSNLLIKLIKQVNSGPAKARNLGVQNSNGEIIIFLDSDCITPPNWIEMMIEPLKGNVIGCNCGYRVKNKNSLIARYINNEIAYRHEKMLGQKIGTIGTYSASFVKSIFTKAGGFNTEYTSANAEDFDLGFTINRMGYSIRFTGETFVWHFHVDSVNKYLKQQFSRGYWRVKMYLRNKDKIVKGDSYTGHEAQFQFIYSNLAFVSLILIAVNPYFPLIGFGLLLISNLPLGLWAYRREKKYVLIAPVLASLRSLSGTIGAYTYAIKHLSRWLKEYL
ncbi:glycosyltransferase [Chloroflexota bacterium]